MSPWRTTIADFSIPVDAILLRMLFLTDDFSSSYTLYCSSVISQKTVCSVTGGRSRATISFVRLKINGWIIFLSLSSCSSSPIFSIGFANSLLKKASSPSNPGLTKFNWVQRSVSEFSIGVPVRTSLNSEINLVTVL